METANIGHESPAEDGRRHGRGERRALRWTLGVLWAYVVAAYVVIPWFWERYARRHPAFDDNPRITTTGDGHPGDPLNVALIGTSDELDGIMQAAKWFPAAALGLRSDLKIAADTVLSRPDDEAPVSSLFLFGRKEDAAFEQPVGDNPRKRHHVRFWRTSQADDDGRPMWIGSATYDERVGLSRATGQVTHHIDGAVDVERDHLFDCLEKTGELAEQWAVDEFHPQRQGTNGGGDVWHTDGALLAGRISESRSVP